MSDLFPAWYSTPVDDSAEPEDAGIEHVGGTEADDMDIYFKEESDSPKPPENFDDTASPFTHQQMHDGTV